MEANRIERHLKTLLSGDVCFDDITRTIYSTAACLYKIKPLGVVYPKNAEDLVKLVEYALDQRIPLTARGAGSSLAGQTVNDGVIVDLSKYMNRILDLNPDEGYVVVQPGVVQDVLQKELKRHGKFFPPDTSSSAYSTLGGGIGNNSSGARSVKYGTTKDYVISLRAVLSDGDMIQTRPVSLDLIPEEFPGRPGSLEEEIYTGLKGIVLENWDLIERYRPRTKSSSGYNLFEVVQEDVFDLAKLIVGSEGTLCIVTETKLRIIDLPEHRAVAMAYFDDVVKAGRAVPLLLELDPSAIDVMDGMVVDLVRDRERELNRFLPEGVEMAYLIEFDGIDEDQVRRKIEQAEKFLRDEGLVFAFVPAKNEDEAALLWKIRKAGSAILGRVKGEKRPLRFIEDVSVPPDRLAEFLDKLWGILKQYDVRVGTIGHAGDSNFHVRPLLNPKDPTDIEKICRIADETYSLVVEMGGSISGEHGDGLLRTPFLKKQFGELYDLLFEVKRIFDPANILNPGKIIPQEGKGFIDNLRFGPNYRYIRTESKLDDERIHEELEKCDGCGSCRSYCPVFQGMESEIGASRAKVNLIRAVLTGDLPPEMLTSDEFKSVMDLCYNCRRCLDECPSLTNVPTLCLEARAAYVREHGLSLQNLFLGNASKIAPLATLFAPLANLSMQLKPIRWMMHSLVGIHMERSMPKYRFMTLSRRYDRPKLKGEKKVAYFPGCYANYNDPSGEGVSTVEILRRHGFEVYIPKTKCCNVAKITMGGVDSAMDDIQENVDILLGLVDEGFEVIFSAPSCLLAVRTEYPEILGDDRSKRLAEHCHYIFEFLVSLKERGELDSKFEPLEMRAAYQIPCHLRTLGKDRTLEILKRIPGLQITTVTDKCCGIAGTFGMKKQYYELSLKIGKPLFQELTSSGAEMVISSCGTCRLQIEEATGLKTIHPVEVLFRSYMSAPTLRAASRI
jgi:anaerobic glycerol-3-phosphate dehydrogenase C subunit